MYLHRAQFENCGIMELAGIQKTPVRKITESYMLKQLTSLSSDDIGAYVLFSTNAKRHRQNAKIKQIIKDSKWGRIITLPPSKNERTNCIIYGAIWMPNKKLRAQVLAARKKQEQLSGGWYL